MKLCKKGVCIMKKLTSKEIVRRMSLIATVVLALYLLSPLYDFVRGFIIGWNSVDVASSGAGVVAGIQSLLILVLAVILIVNAFRLLGSLRKDETPFTEANGRYIRNISFVLIAIEPITILCNIISNALAENISVVMSFGGMMLAAGFVMYCISLAFRYGCELQQESDETL